MKIAIFMASGCQNLGDELILKNEIDLLRDKYKDFNPEFQVFSYDTNDQFVKAPDIKYFEYFPVGIRNPKNILNNILNFINFIKISLKSSIIVIGGGGIIFDNEVGDYSNPLKQWLYRTIFFNFLNKKVIFWGVSVDIKNQENNKIVNKIFSCSNEVYVRDIASNKYLEQIGINSSVVLDSVFYDNGTLGLQNYKTNFLKKSINAKDFSLGDLMEFDFSNKTVGLALRDGYIKGGVNPEQNDFINTLIDYILGFENAKIILIPHSFHKIDKKANDYLFLSKFVRQNVEICENMQEVYENYNQKKIDFCLSMRLHSMILSQVYGIDFIALKYAKKSDLM